MIKIRFILLLVIFIFQYSISIAQCFGEICIDTTKVKGQYTSRHKYIYQYKFGELDSNSKFNSEITKFNKAGNIVELITYDYDNNKQTNNYKYNSKNNLIEFSFKSKKSVVKCYAKYDKYDRVIERGISHQNNYFFINPDIYIKVIKFKYDSNGNVTEEIKYLDDGTLACKNTFEYNNNGKIINIDEYWIKRNISDFPYNDNSTFIKYKFHNGKKCVDYIHIQNISFDYDDVGNLKKQNYYYEDIGNPEGIETIITFSYKFNELGELVEENKYWDNSNRKIVYSINNANTQEIDIIYTYNNEESRSIRLYDPDKRLIEEEQIDDDPDYSFRMTYNYDKYGNLIEKIRFNGLNEPVEKIEYIYK